MSALRTPYIKFRTSFEGDYHQTCVSEAVACIDAMKKVTYKTQKRSILLD